MASLFRFFAFALLVILSLVAWAFFDYSRNRRKAASYFRERLGMAKDLFTMTRFVNMARVVIPETERFIAVFFRKGEHLEIREFAPDRVIDIPPDSVLLSDSSRNLTWIFVERSKTIFSLKVTDFLPGTLCHVRKGTGRVRFGDEDIPASNRDWFLMDRERGVTFSLPNGKEKDNEEGFFFYDGFAPTEGFLLDEDGGVLLVDEKRGTFGFREVAGEALTLYRPDDIVSATPSVEGPDFVDITVRDGKRPRFTFEFDDEGEARYWMEWFVRVRDEMSGKGTRTGIRFVRISPVKIS